jgi:hypothetical protein
MIRMACTASACTTMRNLLAKRPKLDDSSLKTTQQLLEKETQEKLLWYALRGERARIDEDWAKVESGDPKATAALVTDAQAFSLYTEDTALAPLERFLRAGQYRLAKVRYLRQLNEAIEIAGLPVDQQRGRFVNWQGPSVVAEASLTFHKHIAQLRCTAAGLAVARYRLAREIWPTDWQALVPAYLEAVPVDPFDGNPLRIKRTADGLVIYSLGHERPDDQGFRLYERQ